MEARAHVWLIAPDGEVRALLRAQLLEEGYEVTAMADWEALRALLGEEVLAPRLVIGELTGEEPPGALSLLRSLPAPRLVLRSGGAPGAAELRARGIDAVLSRPYAIGDVVRAARSLLTAAAPKQNGPPTRQVKSHGP